MTCNQASVKALKKVQRVIDSFGLPLIKARKFNGILNAIEMQIEDYAYQMSSRNQQLTSEIDILGVIASGAKQ